MATPKRSTNRPPAEALVACDGDLIKALMKNALQEVLGAEITELLGAAPNERSETRSGYGVGYYGRALVTRIGKLELRVPRVRHGEFSTALFERYGRSEKALVAALAEMYVQGVLRLRCPRSMHLPALAMKALAHKLARAAYYMMGDGTACEIRRCFG